MAIVSGIKWTKLRVLVIAGLAIDMGALSLLNYLSEIDYARCVSESGSLCPVKVKVSFNVPIIIVAFAMAATAFLGREKPRPTSSS